MRRVEDRSLPDPEELEGGLPRAAHLALWLAACVQGRVSPDDFIDHVRGEDPRHLVDVGEDSPGGLLELVALARRSSFVGVAVPAPGDPVGLAGPAAFNHEALAAGSALLFRGPDRGVVPLEDARTLVWRVLPASVPPPLDPAECDRQLRATLTTTATALAEAEVSRWAPEIPDLLLNAGHRDPLDLPPGCVGRRREALERAVLCLDAVALAPHHPLLAGLARAARRTVAAFCSDSLSAS